jgi:hypothetical protein
MMGTTPVSQGRSTPAATVRRPHLGAVVLFGIVTLYAGARLLRHPSHLMPPPAGDVWVTFWNYWWTRKALFDLHVNPFHTAYLSYPHEASLVFHAHDFLHGLLVSPLRALVPGLPGLTLSVNAVVLMGFFLSALTMYASSWALTRCWPAALVAGFAYSFSAFHIAWFAMPVMSALYWLPLFTWLFLRATRNGGTLSWMLPGICFGLCTFQSLYYTLFLAILSVFLSVLALATGDSTRFILRRLLLVYAAVIIWALPMATIIAADMAQSRYETPGTSQLGAPKNIDFDCRSSVDLAGLVVPGSQQGLWRRYAQPWNTYLRRPGCHFPLFGLNGEGGQLAYVGIIPLFLAVLSWQSAARRTAVLWTLCALSFAALALGPNLHVAGHILRQWWLPLPYRVLSLGPTFFARMFRNPSSFWAPALFAIWTLAAFGLAALLSAIQSRRRMVVTWMVIAIWLMVDYASPPLPAWPLHVSDLWLRIARDPRPFALLQVPTDNFIMLEAYDFYQTVHHKPIARGYLARQDAAMLARSELIQEARQSTEALTRLLGELGPCYIVVHKSALQEGRERTWAMHLAAVVGESPRYEDSEVMVYAWQLPPIPEGL